MKQLVWGKNIMTPTCRAQPKKKMSLTTPSEESNLKTKVTLHLTRGCRQVNILSFPFPLGCNNAFAPRDCSSSLSSVFAVSPSSLAGWLHDRVSPEQRRIGSPPLELDDCPPEEPVFEQEEQESPWVPCLTPVHCREW